MLLAALALPCREMPSAGRRKDKAFVRTASGGSPLGLSPPEGPTVGGSAGPSAPLPGRRRHFPTGRVPSQPYLDRLLPQPSLTAAGRLFHSNSLRWL